MAGTQKVGARQHDTTFAGILLCQAATHGRTQLHAVAERLSISFGDNNWVSPVSETQWLEPLLKQCACGKHSSVVSASEML